MSIDKVTISISMCSSFPYKNFEQLETFQLLCMQWLQLWQRQKRTLKEELRQVKDL
jgi:hypothetical protein